MLPSGKLPLEARSEAVAALDVGRTAAELLFDPRPGTRIVNVMGPTPYSALDAAEILSRLLAKPVTAVPSSREETVAGLWLPAWVPTMPKSSRTSTRPSMPAAWAFPTDSGEMRRNGVTLEGVLRRLVGGGR